MVWVPSNICLKEHRILNVLLFVTYFHFQLGYVLCMFKCKCKNAEERRLCISPVYILTQLEENKYNIEVYLTEEPKSCLERVD